MVEVFRTNVTCPEQAMKLVKEIQSAFEGYRANFDLDDCDKILRVQSSQGDVISSPIIVILEGFGFTAEVLSDQIDVNNLAC